MKKVSLFLVVLLVSMTAFSQSFSKVERDLILSGPETEMLRVTQVTDSADLKILKAVSTDINPKDKLIPVLAKRMYLAMRDPARPGVGIAAPQVGINKNIIWVQRFDKPNEPFEYYVNPKIVWRSNLIRKGAEGCLSIPDERGDVYRNYTIQISYFDAKGNFKQEVIEGFTAVIFQHEIDHLNGILFTDRMIEQLTFKEISLSETIKLSLESETKR
jgi:peptide deformylase